MAVPVVHFRDLDPDQDAGLVETWVDLRHSPFWRSHRGGAAAWRESLHRNAVAGRQLWIGVADRRSVCFVESYIPQLDPACRPIPLLPGDRGFHLLMAPLEAPGSRMPGLSWAVVRALSQRLFDDPTTRRLVAEPDVRNLAMLRLVQRAGFTLGPVIQLPHKTARLITLDRDAHQALARRGSPIQADGPRSVWPVVPALVAGQAARWTRRITRRLRALWGRAR